MTILNPTHQLRRERIAFDLPRYVCALCGLQGKEEELIEGRSLQLMTGADNKKHFALITPFRRKPGKSGPEKPI